MPVEIKSIWDLPREELFSGGHRLCAGCPVGVIMRLLTKVCGRNTIVVAATGCMEVATTPYPYTSWGVPWIHVAFENAAAVASGVEAALKVLARKGLIDSSRKVNVVAVAGDGGTFDIGLQALSGMLERGHRVMYVVYDNEAYMNTGIQRSGATPLGAWTTTTPVGKKMRGELRPKKDLLGIVCAHRVPYVAASTPAHPVDLARKFKRGLETEGPSVIHVLSPCPTGWRFEPHLSIKVAKLAVETGAWINYEIEKGETRVTTSVPRRKPVREYLLMQGRFSHLTEKEIQVIQEIVDENVEKVNKAVGREVIGPVVER